MANDLSRIVSDRRGHVLHDTPLTVLDRLSGLEIGTEAAEALKRNVSHG